MRIFTVLAMAGLLFASTSLHAQEAAVSTVGATACPVNALVIINKDGKFACTQATSTFAGSVALNKLLVGSSRGRLLFRVDPDKSDYTWPSSALMVWDSANETYTDSVAFSGTLGTQFKVNGAPMLTLGMYGAASAYFNADVYINPVSEGGKPSNLYAGGVIASKFEILKDGGGSTPLTAPPVCIGKNVLQFDGAKYRCVSLASLLR